MLTVFAGTYLVIAVGRMPGFRVDRAGAALIGASLMVALGALPLDAAYQAVDLNTLTLLLGMMIVVANLRLSGFFRLVNSWVITRVRHPFTLLVAVTLIAGILSAFLVNDTICLVLTPLIINLLRQLKRNPVPYLLAVALASNVGSTATITGNPQNMIIGSISHISYQTFAAALSPVAGIGLVLTVMLIAIIYRSEFWTHDVIHGKPQPAHSNRPIITKTLIICSGMAIGFFAGLPPAEVAILSGALLLFTRRIKSEKVYVEIDWRLLLMFAGLFMVVSGLERNILSRETTALIGDLHLERLPVLSAVTVILSNLVSNVPAVLALKSFIVPLHDQERAWLTIAMASTLAGNLTMLGSVANLIVVQGARAQGIHIGFWQYLKVGAPLTVMTVMVGVLWLSWW